MSKVSSLEWVVGDRIITPAKKLGEVSSVRAKKITITWENGHLGEYTAKEMQSYDYQKFLEEKEAIAECYFYTPVSLQESEDLTSELMPPEQPTSSRLNSSSKITAMRNSSLNTDFLISPSTAIWGASSNGTENRDKKKKSKMWQKLYHVYT